MGSNNGVRGLYAGADIFKPAKIALSGVKPGGKVGGQEAPTSVKDKNQTARFAPDTHGRTMTAKGRSGGSNKAKGQSGSSPKVIVRKA